MKKFLLSVVVIMITAGAVYLSIVILSSIKSQQLLEGVLSHSAEIKDWHKGKSTYNIITKVLNISDLNVAFKDNITLHINKITVDALNDNSNVFNKVTINGAVVSKDNDTILSITSLILNNADIGSMRSTDWVDRILEAGKYSALLGFWPDPVVDFDNISISGLSLNNHYYGVSADAMGFIKNTSNQNIKYFIEADNVSFKTPDGRELLKFDNVSNSKSYDGFNDIYVERIEARTDGMASLSITFEENDYKDRLSNQGTSLVRNLDPDVVTILFENTQLMEQLYSIAGFFTGLTSENMQQLIIELVNNKVTQTKAPIMDAIKTFIKTPESLNITISYPTARDGYNVQLSVNGEEPIIVENLSDNSSTEDMKNTHESAPDITEHPVKTNINAE